jgi:hypothetical protein
MCSHTNGMHFRTSGMAAIVLSVTTRYGAWPDIPSPKPMVTPSISATKGLRMRAMRVMRLYSAARALAATTLPPPSLHCSAIFFTSPPEQNARGVLPSSSTALHASFAQKAASSRSTASTIASSAAFSASGRASVITPMPLACR